MAAIFKREFNSYFNTFIGYIFLAVFFLISAYSFVFENIAAGSAGMFSVINTLAGVMWLLVPLLSMRIFAEEFKQKTDQMLFTSPVPVYQIVLGKYLAAQCVIGTASVLSFIFPAIMYIYGNPFLGEIILAYLGFHLLSGALLAIGILISTLSEHQLISGLISFLAIILLMSMGPLTAGISGGMLRQFLSWFAVFDRFYFFSAGIISFDAIVYYAAFTAMFLLLTTLSLRRKLGGA